MAGTFQVVSTAITHFQFWLDPDMEPLVKCALSLLKAGLSIGLLLYVISMIIQLSDSIRAYDHRMRVRRLMDKENKYKYKPWYKG